MESLWNGTANMHQFPSLRRSMKVDVLIIGGGLAGLLCAYQLAKEGVDCIVVEERRICGGITQNTTAKITAQHGLVYQKLMKKLGEERSRQYLQAQLAAGEEYRELCKQINCDYEEKLSYVYTTTDLKKLEQEQRVLDTLGHPTEIVDDLPLPITVKGAICFGNQAQFHPLKFAMKIAKNLRVYEHTKVLELGKHIAVTNHGTVRAKHIIIATHFPMLNKHGSYFLKLYQERSYVLALRGAPQVDGMYVDESKDGLSFRNAGEYLILGGGSKRTGKKTTGWQELEDFAAQHYPKAKPAFRWAAQDCMTLDGSAYIGPYSANTTGLYVATGFNKWGMTNSMVASHILTDRILGRDNPYAPAFDPSRSVFHLQLAANAGESMLNLLTPTVPRCPHLGCALKYNAQERTWDCPCHGSRFTETGKRIDNPATDDKR